MFFRVATLAALLLAPLYAQAPAKTETASELPDARELINRHVKAVGGREAILGHKSMHATGTLSVPASGISGPMEIFGAADPDRVARQDDGHRHRRHHGGLRRLARAGRCRR